LPAQFINLSREKKSKTTRLSNNWHRYLLQTGAET